MHAKVVARVLLTLGFLAASLAYSSWTAERTVLDPTATRGATHALLATPAVNEMLTRELRNALAPALAHIDAAAANQRKPARQPAKPLGPKARAAQARAAHEATVKLNAAITAAVHDPKFTGAFEDAIMQLHERVLSGGNGQVTLDPNAVTDAINRAIAHVDPKAAPQAKRLQTVSVPLGASNLPHLGDVRHDARVVANTALAIVVLLIGGALLLAPDRKAFRRMGRRVAFLALAPALVFLVLPRLLANSHNTGAAVSAVVLEAFGRRVLFSAALLAGIGTTVWLVAAIAPARRPAEPDAPPPTAAAPPLPDTRAPSAAPVPAETAVFRP